VLGVPGTPESMGAHEAPSRGLWDPRPSRIARAHGVDPDQAPPWPNDRRLPDDKAIARELGISPNAAKVARWRYAARRDKPHVARIAA
jgi:hypothetical protein